MTVLAKAATKYIIALNEGGDEAVEEGGEVCGRQRWSLLRPREGYNEERYNCS